MHYWFLTNEIGIVCIAFEYIRVLRCIWLPSLHLDSRLIFLQFILHLNCIHCNGACISLVSCEYSYFIELSEWKWFRFTSTLNHYYYYYYYCTANELVFVRTNKYQFHIDELLIIYSTRCNMLIIKCNRFPFLDLIYCIFFTIERKKKQFATSIKYNKKLTLLSISFPLMNHAISYAYLRLLKTCKMQYKYLTFQFGRNNSKYYQLKVFNLLWLFKG